MVLLLQRAICTYPRGCCWGPSLTPAQCLYPSTQRTKDPKENKPKKISQSCHCGSARACVRAVGGAHLSSQQVHVRQEEAIVADVHGQALLGADRFVLCSRPQLLPLTSTTTLATLASALKRREFSSVIKFDEIHHCGHVLYNHRHPHPRCCVCVF